MIVKFNLNLSAWVKDIEVEGKSVEDAKENLYKMSIEDLIGAGYIKSFDLTDIDDTIEESTLKVKVYNIEYEEDPELGEELPEILILTIENVSDKDNLENLIAATAEDEDGLLIRDFDYMIIDEY